MQALIPQIKQRIQEKAAEYRDLKHKQQLIDVALERTLAYVARLNDILVAEGEKPIKLWTTVEGNAVRRPGNRAKDLPVRRIEWEGMPIRLIIQRILSDTQTPMHGNDMAKRVYEIQTDNDLKRVKASLVSQLHRGAKQGWWEAAGRNTYRAKWEIPDLPQLQSVSS